MTEQTKSIDLLSGRQALLNRLGRTVAESFFNNLKNERVHGRWYATRDEARTDAFDDIETFYKRSRRHFAMVGKTPASAFEAWVLKR